MRFLISVACLTHLSALAFGQTSFVGEPLFEQTFAGGSEALENWKMKERSMWKITAEGHLASHFPEGAKIVGCSSPGFSEGSDLTYSFDFKLQEGRELTFKINYSKGGHIYRLAVNPNGFLLRINTNQQIPITKSLAMERLSARIDPDRWHTMTIVQKGDTVTASIPKVGTKTYHNSVFKNPVSTIGISASGSEILFDNIRVVSTSRDIREDESAPPSVASSGDWTALLEPFFAEYCYECHDDLSSKGDLDLYALSTDLGDAEILRRWVRIFDRVEKGEMPPDSKPRPEQARKIQFLEDLTSPLLAGHQAQKGVVLRRLNRAEYENTINELFGIDLRIAETFPADAKKHGFDNNGEGLTLSSELIELYLQTANLAFDHALGPPEPPKQTRVKGEIRDYIHENMYERWQKLMEDQGGTVIYSSEFGAGSQMNLLKLPEPGIYRWRFHVRAYQSDKPVMMQIQTGQLTRQGDKRFVGFYEIPPEGRVVEFTDFMRPGESAYPRPFGTLKNISGFLGPKQGEERGLTIRDYDGAGILVEHFEVEGPIEEWPPPSRSKLLGEHDLGTGTIADGQAILESFLPRVFRRPVTDAELASYSGKLAELMGSGRSFKEALRWAVTAALCSPEFLFLEEPTERDSTIDDFALANRLSYFLWSSMPDEGLFALAGEKKLRDADVLQQQVERMLASEKSKAFTDNFAHQWLHLRDIDATSPDTKLFPEFDDYLKYSMVRESEAFFETILRENESVQNLIESDWVIVNERLARHYEIPNVTGEAFRRVSLPSDSVRGGIMTQASVLKVTANGANTSPITRGVWILENLLGIHPPPPPPSIPAVVPDVSGAKTLRQLLDAHRNETRCQSCHELIDPPGFALESFDPVGAWRTDYAFQGSRNVLPVDATGVTDKGERFENVRDYKQILLGEIDQVTYGLVEKLLTYATGRAMGFSDREEIHRIVAASAETDYGFRDLIHLTVQSPIFHQP